MRDLNRILEDKRDITILFLTDGEQFEVGQLDIEKIIPYEELGEMGMVIWFAVYVHGQVIMRFNSRFVEGVGYREI